MERNCTMQYWSWWTAASCQRMWLKGGGVGVSQHWLQSLGFLSCCRRCILCCGLVMRELMFCLNFEVFISQDLQYPPGSHAGLCWAWDPPEDPNHPHWFNSTELLAVVSELVIRLSVHPHTYPWDEFDEGGVYCELREFDRLVTGGAAVGMQGEKQGRVYTALGRSVTKDLRVW